MAADSPQHLRFTDSRLIWSEGPNGGAQRGNGGNNGINGAGGRYAEGGVPNGGNNNPVRHTRTASSPSRGQRVQELKIDASSQLQVSQSPLPSSGSVSSGSSLMLASMPTPSHMHLRRTKVHSSSYKSSLRKQLHKQHNQPSVRLDLQGNPYEIPTSAIPPGRTRPWNWRLQFWDRHLEAQWLLVLFKHRRWRTWVLEVIGTVVFLLLVLTDLGSSVFASGNDEVDSFGWYKGAFRLGTGLTAALLLGLEHSVSSIRTRWWIRVRTANVVLCCTWAVVFASVGGLADMMNSAPVKASCDGGEFVMQDVRLHPAAFLLLFAGPVLEVPFLHVLLAASVTGITELGLALAANMHGSLFLVFDHIGVTLLLIGASVAAAHHSEQSARALFLQNFKLSKENKQLTQVLSMRLTDGDSRTAILSNSEKVLDLLNRLRQRVGEDEELVEVMDLMQRAGGLFTPDLSELEHNDAVEAPIKEWLLQGPARLGDQKRHMRRKATSIIPPPITEAVLGANGVPVTPLPTPNNHVARFISSTDFFNFALDVLALADDTPKVLCLIAESVIVSFDLVEKLDLSPLVLHAFLSRLDSGYLAKNPYHNANHGASVTWDMQYYLRAGRGERFLTRLEVFGCIIAAAGHDFRHPGVNNQFLIATKSDIAICYNDQSVLENFHAAETFKLGRSAECPLFDSLSVEDFTRFREVVVSMVLATDVSKHFGHVAKLKTKSLATPTASAEALGKVADVDLLTTSLILLCDLGHAAKPFDLHLRWTELVTEEFYRQGDAEKAAGMKVSPLCDRETTNLAKSQTGFFDFLVLPLFETFSRVHMVYKFQPILEQVRTNISAWRQRAAAESVAAAEGPVSAVAHSTHGKPPLQLAVDSHTPRNEALVRAANSSHLSDAGANQGSRRTLLNPLPGGVSQAPAAAHVVNGGDDTRILDINDSGDTDGVQRRTTTSFHVGRGNVDSGPDTPIP